ncbi:heparinase II/III family protein [bacterium]|nr:heparinase II/III family protein [bacterium]
MAATRRLVGKVVIGIFLFALLGGAHGSRPMVFLTEGQIKTARKRIVNYDWARRSYDSIERSARTWLNKRLDFPEGPTGWYHDYFCPEHGFFLRYNEQKPHEHYCPAGEHYVRGEKLDAYWRAITLRRIVDGARDLATVYAIERDRKFARAAGKMLLPFADYYGKYVQGRKPPRLMWQTLDEATYILHAVAAYELIYDSEVLSEEHRRRIEEKWLKPTAEFIKSQTRVIHNIHCWQNSAVLCIGLVLGDKSLVDFAIENPRSGFRRQMAEGVLDDGLWRECSFGYHFYTISALENTIIPAMNNGIDISAELATARKMFMAPILCADGQFELPSPNDGRGGVLTRHTRAYELAYFLFPDEEKFGGLLRRAYGASTTRRSGRDILFYGAEKLPKKALQPERASVNLTDSGLGILRSSRGRDSTYIAMDYGPHGGGHGHPDKLNVILSGLGQMFSPDLGSAGYGLKVHRSWYKQSLSHNVVVVDRKSQKASAGKLVDFRGTGDVKWVSARADEAYPGVRWQRTVFLCDDGYAVIADSLQSEKEHLFDWVYHCLGELDVAGVKMEVMSRERFGAGAGYDVPKDVRAGSTRKEVVATWQLDRTRRVLLRIPPVGGTNEVISAIAPGNPSMIEMPMIVQRKKQKTADFWAVIEPVKGKSRISRTVVSDGKLTVEQIDRKRRTYSVEGGHPAVAGGLSIQ